RTARELGTHHGDVAPMVVDAVRLLVRGVVLLVDDDEPESAQRREHGGARADDDSRRAARDAPPLVPALAHRELAVEDSHRIAEARADPLDDLMRERDLR